MATPKPKAAPAPRPKAAPAPKPKAPAKPKAEPMVDAVKSKYADTLSQQVASSAKIGGAKGKADLVAWKRSSGYQADVNQARAQARAEKPLVAAVKQKYSGALQMRQQAAKGKGAKGQAALVGWKRSSGYQSDINQARAEAANKTRPRPTTGDFDPEYIKREIERGRQVREEGGKVIDDSGNARKMDDPGRMDFRQGAEPGSGVEEPQPLTAVPPPSVDARKLDAFRQRFTSINQTTPQKRLEAQTRRRAKSTTTTTKRTTNSRKRTGKG